MKPIAGRLLACALFALLAPAASAATGMTELPAPPGSGPVTVYYPTGAAPAAVQRGPFTLRVAENAPPVRGNGRLIVLSHGTSGSALPEADLAQALVAAGFTIAMPEHAGDNWRDHSAAGPAAAKRRPQEVSQAIDAIAADARFAPLLDLHRVGVSGMSAGGLTALTFAGAQWSPARWMQHCQTHLREDFAGCTLLPIELNGGMWDGLKLWFVRWWMGRSDWAKQTALEQWSDPRVAAVVAVVPVVTPIDLRSLARPRIPVGLVRAGRDAWLAPQWHIDALRAACQDCVLVADMPEAGHGSILAPIPPGVLPGHVERLMGDPPGFDRGVLPAVYAAIAHFFLDNLKP
jgi:predicted dienelactone hydrolase